MKNKLIAVFLFVVLLAICFVGCNDTDVDLKGVTVTFELEGGIYRESDQPIKYYYNFEEGTTNLILSPQDFSEKAEAAVTKTGYVLEGWYTTKEVNGDVTTYLDKWDFATDKVSDEGITLYAKWIVPRVHSYNVCYVDGEGEAQILGTYLNRAGRKFSDLNNYAESRNGYTVIGGPYQDKECTIAWDKNFVHPGGDEDLQINVYYDYIEGDWAVVSTKSELNSALMRGENVYLTADIDMGGANFTSMVKYEGTFEGNNHTISNFKMPYTVTKDSLATIDGHDKSFGISLFGELKNATVKNVNFEGVSVDVNTTFDMIAMIYVSPIAINMTNSTVENVTVELDVTITQIPANADVECIDTQVYVTKDATSVETNCTLDVTVTDNRE